MSNLQSLIGTKVRIKELERNGIVRAVFIGDTGVQYKVRYFDNAESNEVYFYPDELTFKSGDKLAQDSPEEFSINVIS